MVPGYVPFALLAVFEIAAVLAFAFLRAGRAAARPDPLLCVRCARLQRRTETIGSVADAIAIGALAFLVALPFVAAGYERRPTLLNDALGVSAVVATIAVAGEIDFLARFALGRVWPSFRPRAEPARIVGGGSRWLGALLALYLFQPRFGGLAALFGFIGERLTRDLPSTAPIVAAASILAAACFVALVARWLVPIVFGSSPTALRAHLAHGRTA